MSSIAQQAAEQQITFLGLHIGAILVAPPVPGASHVAGNDLNDWIAVAVHSLAGIDQADERARERHAQGLAQYDGQTYRDITRLYEEWAHTCGTDGRVVKDAARRCADRDAKRVYRAL